MLTIKTTIEPHFSNIPQNAEISIWGNGKKSQSFQKLFSSTRPDVKISYIIDSYIENLEHTPPIVKAKDFNTHTNIIIIASSFEKDIIELIENTPSLNKLSVFKIAKKPKIFFEETLIKMINFCISKKTIPLVMSRDSLNTIHELRNTDIKLIKNQINSEHKGEKLFDCFNKGIKYFKNSKTSLDVFSKYGYRETQKGIVTPDIKSPYLNVVNGYRITKYSQKKYSNKIYCIGDSYTFGFPVEDKYTVASFLQKKISKKSLDYSVSNLGVNGTDLLDHFIKLKHLQLKENDIIIFHMTEDKFTNKLKVLLSNIYLYVDLNKLNKHKKLFCDIYHINDLGNKFLAKNIYHYLFNKNLHKMKKINYITDYTNIVDKQIEALEEKYTNFSKEFIKNNKGLKKYINNLKNVKINLKNQTIGSIIMNCNPFTLGHQYLIEYASKQVDTLIIFVLEEDRSYFPFKDRIKLVKEGTKHIKNVKVLNGGSFIISNITFPEYFCKEKENLISINASNDLNIFCDYIAPTLNISVRFAGEEPNCLITNQYNEQMTQILPTYGISFKVISRKKFDKKVISASRVRAIIKSSKNIEYLKKLVPLSTYNYLIQKKIIR